MTRHPSCAAPPRRWSGGALLLCWLLAPLACHFCFSWIGFNPTDDGWLQAVAQRIACGEVPHRDFISVRPVLSAVFNVPLAAWGGDHIIWLSRLAGWLAMAGISVLWARLAVPDGLSDRPAAAFGVPLALYGCAFLLNAHTFPVMAWHSLDGMLWCSVAVATAVRGTRWSWRLAYLAVGVAALCRQNFAGFLPVLMLASPRSARSPAVLWAAIPPVAYFTIMVALGAGRDFVAQILPTGGWFVRVALLPYARQPAFLGPAALGIGAALLMAGRRPAASRLGDLVPAAILAAAGAAAAVALGCGPSAFRLFGFGLFGLAGGLALVALRRPLPDRDRLLVVAGLGLAWCAAISVGYNSPALAAGIVFLCLWRLLPALRPAGAQRPRGLTLALAATCLAVGVAFVYARRQYPYRDRPAASLRRNAGDVMWGAAGLYTNDTTYAVLRDLQQLRARFRREGRIYAILTDFPAAWLRAGERNPLPAPWAQTTELAANSDLIARVLGSLYLLPAEGRIIVQRFRTGDLGRGLLPELPDQPYYGVEHWVRAHCRRTESTACFDVYLPPGPAATGAATRGSTPEKP